MSDKKKNIFISHIHEDDKKVAQLKENLASNGEKVSDYSVTKDNPNNAHNEDYIKREILKPRLDNSRVVAVIVTPETKDSKWVDWEVEYAHEHDKRIVCIWGHGDAHCEIPESLENYADSFVAWNTEKIIKALNGENYSEDYTGGQRPAAQVPPPPQNTKC